MYCPAPACSALIVRSSEAVETADRAGTCPRCNTCDACSTCNVHNAIYALAKVKVSMLSRGSGAELSLMAASLWAQGGVLPVPDGGPPGSGLRGQPAADGAAGGAHLQVARGEATLAAVPELQVHPSSVRHLTIPALIRSRTLLPTANEPLMKCLPGNSWICTARGVVPDSGH